MARVTVVYKNAARAGSYAACPVHYTDGEGEEMPVNVRSAVDAFRAFDCLRPLECASGDADGVFPCKMQVHVCDARGAPCAIAAEHVAPDILVRTDRGAWSAFHAQSVVLLPSSKPALTLHIATKERSNVMRAVLCIAFVSLSTGTVLARSEPLLVLSKPPPSIRQPFARVLPTLDVTGADASVPLEASSRCSPAKWLESVRADTHVMVPLPPAAAPGSWRVHSLGTYRGLAARGVAAPASSLTSLTATATAATVAAEAMPPAVAPLLTGVKRSHAAATMDVPGSSAGCVADAMSGSKVDLSAAKKKPCVVLADVGGEADRADALERELARLRDQLADEQAKRAAAEAERAGLARALRLLVASSRAGAAKEP